MFRNSRDRLDRYGTCDREHLHKFIVHESLLSLLTQKCLTEKNRQGRRHLSRPILRKSGTRGVKYFLLCATLSAQDLLVRSSDTRTKASSYVLPGDRTEIQDSSIVGLLRNPADGKIYFTARVIHEERTLFLSRKRNRESRPAICLESARRIELPRYFTRERIHRLIA